MFCLQTTKLFFEYPETQQFIIKSPFAHIRVASIYKATVYQRIA